MTTHADTSASESSPFAAEGTATQVVEQQALEQAEKAVSHLASQRNNRWYPAFHIASNGGWINDPNGLCQYNGRWHVFYQLHPYGTQWGPMHWGHVSSADMLTWQREPIAMAPTLPEERDGVFSGSAVVDDSGDLRFYYTGHVMLNGEDAENGTREVQMLAKADGSDVHHLRKFGLAVDFPEDLVFNDFRDPKVWKQDDVWFMIVGAQSKEHRGQILLFTSADMEAWNYERILFEHPDPNVFMLECPDFFPLAAPDGKQRWIICFSAMGSKPSGFMNRNVNNAGYMIGSWQPGKAFTPESEFRLWDWGHNYYAPQSFESEDGRRMMYGWMSPMVQPIPMQDDGWCGNLTLPREVYLGEDGDVHTVPAHELLGLRSDTTTWDAMQLASGEERTILDNAEAVELELDIDLSQTTAERAGVKLHCTEDGAYTYVAYDAQMGRVILDRGACSNGDRGYRAAPLSNAELEAQHIRLRIFIDRGCVEVYVNDGSQVLSSYSYPSQGARAVKLCSESGSVSIASCKVHTLRSIGLDE